MDLEKGLRGKRGARKRGRQLGSYCNGLGQMSPVLGLRRGGGGSGRTWMKQVCLLEATLAGLGGRLSEGEGGEER